MTSQLQAASLKKTFGYYHVYYEGCDSIVSDNEEVLKHLIQDLTASQGAILRVFFYCVVFFQIQ